MGAQGASEDASKASQGTDMKQVRVDPLVNANIPRVILHANLHVKPCLDIRRQLGLLSGWFTERKVGHCHWYALCALCCWFWHSSVR